MMTNKTAAVRIPASSPLTFTGDRPDLEIEGWGTVGFRFVAPENDCGQCNQTDSSGEDGGAPPSNWRAVESAFADGRPDAVVEAIALGHLPPG